MNTFLIEWASKNLCDTVSTVPRVTLAQTGRGNSTPTSSTIPRMDQKVLPALFAMLVHALDFPAIFRKWVLADHWDFSTLKIDFSYFSPQSLGQMNLPGPKLCRGKQGMDQLSQLSKEWRSHPV